MLENSPIAAIASFFLVLIPLILIHELGHFLAAKAVGITILEFGLGFPPRIRRLFTWRETEFTLNWIPLGGFVRPLGEDVIRPLAEEQVNEHREEIIKRQQDREETTGNAVTRLNLKSVNEAKPLGRIFFMAAGAFANFLLAFLMFGLIALMGIPQVTGVGIGIINVQPDSVLSKAGLAPGDVIISVNGSDFDNAQTFLGVVYQSEQDVSFTVQQGESGELVTLTASQPIGLEAPSVTRYVQIQGVVTGAPADRAGIQPGDLVSDFNGTPITTVDDFRSRTRENLGQNVNLTVHRGEQQLEISLVPRANPPEGQGAMGIEISNNVAQQDSVLGVTFATAGRIEYVPQPLDQSLRYGGERVVDVITSTVRIPGQLLSGAITPQEARPVSVLGMSQIGAVFLQESIEQRRITPILEFIATISVALGFFNLLPIPALDGGRIVFVLVEIVRGKPITAEREGLVHLIGLALLLSLSVLIFINDLLHPVIELIR